MNALNFSAIRSERALLVRLLREGDHWTLGTTTATLRFKDSKGLTYLAQLLRYPNREFHVLELLALPRVSDVTGFEDKSLLDAETLRSYRLRVEALDEALDRAQTLGDNVSELEARQELAALARQFAEALDGRTRNTRASPTERARVNVQKRLRSALLRIQAQDWTLGRFLEASVKTGMYCVFDPPTWC